MSDGVVALRRVIAEYAEEIEQVMREADWEKLSLILQQRQELMERQIPALANENERVELMNAIESIQAEDAVFLSVLQEKKQQLEKQLRHIKYGRKSIKAYELGE